MTLIDGRTGERVGDRESPNEHTVQRESRVFGPGPHPGFDCLPVGTQLTILTDVDLGPSRSLRAARGFGRRSAAAVALLLAPPHLGVQAVERDQLVVPPPLGDSIRRGRFKCNSSTASPPARLAVYTTLAHRRGARRGASPRFHHSSPCPEQSACFRATGTDRKSGLVAPPAIWLRYGRRRGRRAGSPVPAWSVGKQAAPPQYERRYESRTTREGLSSGQILALLRAASEMSLARDGCSS